MVTTKTGPTPEKKPKVLNRRHFISATGGFTLGFFLAEQPRLAAAGLVSTDINTYITVGADEKITISFFGCEMGQGVMTGLPQIVADELMVDWAHVVVKQADVKPAPYTPVPAYNTGGSSAVRGRIVTLRTAAATAREILVMTAMTKLGDNNRAHYVVLKGAVTNTSLNKSLTYGALAGLVPQPVPVPSGVTLNTTFTLIGTSVPRVDIPSKTDGSAIYGIDVRLPGMVYGIIKHAPAIGGTLVATPLVPPGALYVVPVKASDTRGSVIAGTINAVAVVAGNTWDAMQAAQQLQAQWKAPANPAGVDSTSIAALANSLLAGGTPLQAEPAPAVTSPAAARAAVAIALAGAAHKISSVYTVPYLAHATMEVLNCTVNLTPTSCEIWAPTQAAKSVAAVAAKLLPNINPANIVVHTTFLGGGLGRKGEVDYASQAIQVAIAINKPVKLTWPREEDFAHDQYRPLAAVSVSAGLGSAGNIVAWNYRSVSQSIFDQRGFLAPGAIDSQAVEGSVALPYALGAKLVEWVPLPAGIPVGFWRSVGCSFNSFVVESVLDELAAAGKLDPLAFRKSLVPVGSREWNVLDAADKLSSWRLTLPAGHAWGVAYSKAFLTEVCEVVEISQPAARSLTVHQVACVVDCGLAVNPNQIEAQMQGGIVHGLNAALWGQITFSKGSSSVRNFSNYRMIKLREMPRVTVQILNSGAPIGGIGEPGVPPIAPAIANAYFKLTGTRVRTLPLFPGARMGELG